MVTIKPLLLITLYIKEVLSPHTEVVQEEVFDFVEEDRKRDVSFLRAVIGRGRGRCKKNDCQES